MKKRSGLPKYCVRKTGGSGRSHYYFQREDYRIPLPPPSDDGFEAAYIKALRAMPEKAHLTSISFAETIGMNKNELDSYFKGIERGAKNRAKKAGREYTLPKYWAADQYMAQGGKCALSGITMARSEGRFDPFCPSIDRICSSGGYTPDNCQLVLLHINLAKRDMSEDEFIKLCRSVVQKARETERERFVKTVPRPEMEALGQGKTRA